MCRLVVVAALLVNLAARADEKKDAPLKLTPADMKALKQKDGPTEEEAKKKWDGKLAEFGTLRWSYHQDQTAGPHAGQTMFNLDVGEADTGKHSGNILVVYMKDAKDAGTLKNLPAFNSKVRRVRGKLVVAYKMPYRLWMVDAVLVREPGEWEKEEKEIEAGREAIQKMDKTADGKAFVLTAAAKKAMGRDDKKNRELARAWDRKTVEVTNSFVNGWLEMKEGPHTGQMSIGFAIAETPPPAWADTVYITAYVKDERDVGTLLNRKRNEKPFTVRATMRVDERTGAHQWLEDVRLIRAPGELEKEEKEIEAGRKALREPVKTVDGKALILGVPALKGMQRNDKKNRELTKTWDGKTVEITVGRVMSSQTHKTGPYKGQTTYGFVIDVPGMVKAADQTSIGAYFTDEKDIAEVKSLWSARDKKFKVRGKFEVDDKSGWWLRIVDARLVKD